MASRILTARSFSFGLIPGLMILLSAHRASAQWNQWRGAGRDGAAQVEQPLRTELPDSGLKPLWHSSDDLESGGWSSPIVAGGRVYQYAHRQTRRDDVTLPPEQFPPLTDEQKEKLSPQEQQTYEQKRSEEQRERRGKEFRFTDKIIALDAADGRTVWRFERDSKPTQWRQSSTPAVEGANVYFVGADRRLVCLDASKGTERWTAPIPIETAEDDTPAPISSSPLIVGDRVILLAERLLAFDTSDGALLWTGEARQDGAIYSSPVLWQSGGKARVIANVGQAGTVCVDVENGRELWRVESHAGRSTPVVVGNAVLTYGGSRKGGLRCYDITDEEAELRWKSHRFADDGSSPVIAGDRVFVQGGETFAAVDLETGDTLWQTALDRNNPRYTSPIAAGNQVFYTFGGVLSVPAGADDYTPLYDARIGEEGLLASESYFRRLLNVDSIDEAEAERLWNRRVVSNGPQQCVSPAFAEGRLYIRLNRGLVCYDLRPNTGS